MSGRPDTHVAAIGGLEAAIGDLAEMLRELLDREEVRRLHLPVGIFESAVQAVDLVGEPLQQGEGVAERVGEGRHEFAVRVARGFQEGLARSGRESIKVRGEVGVVQEGRTAGVHEFSSRCDDEAATSSSEHTVEGPSDGAGEVSSPDPAPSDTGRADRGLSVSLAADAASRIRGELAGQQISLALMAARSGVRRGRLGDITKDRSPINLTELETIADELEVTPAYLMGLTDYRTAADLERALVAQLARRFARYADRIAMGVES